MTTKTKHHKSELLKGDSMQIRGKKPQQDPFPRLRIKRNCDALLALRVHPSDPEFQTVTEMTDLKVMPGEDMPSGKCPVFNIFANSCDYCISGVHG